MSGSRRLGNPLVLMTLGFLFCAGSVLEASYEVVGRQAAQVPVISNGTVPRPPDGKARTFVFKEDLTIGVREGDENYMFGSRYLYINVDDNGNIYAVDWDRKRIQKYGPDGKYLLTIGRPGQGPGEFGNVWAPHFDKDKRLFVRDIVNHKLAFFDLDGEFVKTVNLPEKAGDIQINSRGEYVGVVNEEKPDLKLGMRVIYSHGLFDKDFNPLAVFQQTTWTPTRSSGRDPESIAKYLSDVMSKGAFAPGVTLLLAGDDKIYVGFPETYEVRVYSPGGKLERLIRKDQSPLPVTEIHKKDYAASQERDFTFALADRIPESVRKKALSMIRYPKYLPAYQTFCLMDDDWLAVVVDANRDGTAMIDIFDERGNYIAEVSAPISVEGLMFKNDKAYAVKTDEDGYKFVKRYSFEVREY